VLSPSRRLSARVEPFELGDQPRHARWADRFEGERDVAQVFEEPLTRRLTLRREVQVTTAAVGGVGSGFGQARLGQGLAQQRNAGRVEVEPFGVLMERDRVVRIDRGEKPSLGWGQVVPGSGGFEIGCQHAMESSERVAEAGQVLGRNGVLWPGVHINERFNDGLIG